MAATEYSVLVLTRGNAINTDIVRAGLMYVTCDSNRWKIYYSSRRNISIALAEKVLCTRTAVIVLALLSCLETIISVMFSMQETNILISRAGLTLH